METINFIPLRKPNNSYFQILIYSSPLYSFNYFSKVTQSNERQPQHDTLWSTMTTSMTTFRPQKTGQHHRRQVVLQYKISRNELCDATAGLLSLHTCCTIKCSNCNNNTAYVSIQGAAYGTQTSLIFYCFIPNLYML